MFTDMRLVLIAAVLAAELRAGSIRGVVLDNQTGRPLARATVVAQPIAGTPGTPRSVRSGLNGDFHISQLAPGAWLVIATRRGFAPTPNPQGPVTVAEASDVTVSIRLLRFGAITGTVLDENDVGLQEHDVVAYRDARPLAIAARAKTDDRGVYRLDGLAPGAYLVRSVGREYDEGAYLPTFSREVLRRDEARAVDVQYDRKIAHVDVRPFPGALTALSGVVFGQGPISVSLISDVGIHTATPDSNGVFRFPPLPPGPYELYAQGRGVAAWQRVNLYNDSQPRINLAPYPELRLALEDPGGQPIDPAGIPILVRRRDLAGEGKSEPLRQQGRVLPPGRWEFTLAPTPAHYAVRPQGWAETIVAGPGPVDVKFVLSTRPATLRGVVRNAAREPVAGVPVQLGEIRSVRTDVAGQFEFYGLAPGRFRVLATFAALSPNDANSAIVNLEEGQDRSIDLDLHIAR
jgi:hypothetical protein